MALFIKIISLRHRYFWVVLISIMSCLLPWVKAIGQKSLGAKAPWPVTTYEAENMTTSGKLLGPVYGPYQVQTASSDQMCVALKGANAFVAFTAQQRANAMVIRYSLTDGASGESRQAGLLILINGKAAAHAAICSKYSWLYGDYPFTNRPQAGKPRNFYDACRIKALSIEPGDQITIKLEGTPKDASSCMIDLVDLENVPPPLKAPQGAIWLTDARLVSEQTSAGDYTVALRKAINLALKSSKKVWIPAGVYQISGDILLPSDICIQGAGMWYTNFVGDSANYPNPQRRVRFKGAGDHIYLSDFSITGKLDYRSDEEENDGIVGSFGTNSTIRRLWIEHTKVGMWLDNSSHLTIEGCRLRNTIADGINLWVGVTSTVIENCSARGTGDDCFAIWPMASAAQKYQPGHNLIKDCTAQLPFLANGIAIYGGNSNQVRDCLLKDISAGSAILLSTTFPTKKGAMDNNFSGKTRIENCRISKSGGFDHSWDWRGAVEICLDKKNITGIVLKELSIDSSLSSGIHIIGHTDNGTITTNTDTLLNFQGRMDNIRIGKFGLGTSVNTTDGLSVTGPVGGVLECQNTQLNKTEHKASRLLIKGD